MSTAKREIYRQLDESISEDDRIQEERDARIAWEDRKELSNDEPEFDPDFDLEGN